MKRVLVTGGGGFIGQAVCRELQSRGMSDQSFDTPNDIKNLELYEIGDIDAIINLAGVLGSSETIGAERHAAEVNIVGALTVMDVARARNIPMVQIATGHEGQPNPYAITKKCITDLALSRSQWTGQRITVVRAYHVYGPGQKMCAPHGKSKVRKIIPSFVARALTGMPLEINGSGKQIIDLVYLDDVAKVLVDALDGPYGQVIEAGTGMGTTVNEAASDVLQATHSKSIRVHGPMRNGEPECAVVVAMVPLCVHPWPHKLDETIEWYRAQIVSKAVGDATAHKREELAA